MAFGSGKGGTSPSKVPGVTQGGNIRHSKAQTSFVNTPATLLGRGQRGLRSKSSRSRRGSSY